MNEREGEMNERDLVERLLGPEGADVGCDGGFALLAEYVQAELEGRDVGALYPAVAAHLRNCTACMEDYRGLLVLHRESHGGLD
jgi:hypothetical protein